jgi:hypothetical protein
MRGADRGQKAGLIWLAEHRAGAPFASSCGGVSCYRRPSGWRGEKPEALALRMSDVGVDCAAITRSARSVPRSIELGEGRKGVSHEYDTHGHLRHAHSSVGDNRVCPDACCEFGTKDCCHVQRSVCYARSAASVLYAAVRYRRPGGRDLGTGSTAVRRDGQQKCRGEPLAIRGTLRFEASGPSTLGGASGHR